MKKLFIPFFLFSFLGLNAQVKRPKLIVGLVVDQMRWDYLYRYNSRFGSGGFNRLLQDGFSCENTFIQYTPTYTAAGHSSVYTGSVPSLNGIIGNNWYSKALGRVVYCTEDNEVQTVGSTSAAGQMSPKNLWSNTITDEMRLATNFKSKTISIAIKDRGAILPGGHTANAAYWFDNATGGWVSSTYYMQQLPNWVNKINSKKLPDAYLKKDWNLLFPANTYVQSSADNNVYESALLGEDNTFPHITGNLVNNKYEAFKHTPYGNNYTFDMAMAAIEGEKLGMDSETDFLTISLSSPDYIGHAFGPNSVEIEDMYLRLDKELEAFLKHLDAKIGKGEYLLFLTADHGAAHVPAYVTDNRMPGGVTGGIAVLKMLNDTVGKKYGLNNLISSIINYQVYLSDSVILSNHVDKKELKGFITQQLLQYPGVANVVDLEQLETTPLPQQVKMMLVNGYNQKLSGDIQYLFKPQWFDGGVTGTTHGAWNPYDAHIPLLWFGWNVKSGKTNREVYMTDIAPTVASMLHIQMPNAAIGKVIEEVIKKEE